MLIKNGTLVTGSGLKAANLEFHSGKITAWHQPEDDSSTSSPDLDTQDIDASGLWVLPGAVDAHTHFGMPLGSGISSLGWQESSTAALLGGTTTVIDFANPETGQPLGDAVDRWRQMADGRILCDYGLHCTVVEASPERLAEIPGLIAGGIPTLKGFLAYKDRLMLKPDSMRDLMRAVKQAGGLLLVHAEDGQMNAEAQEILLQSGRIGPRYHPLAHPDASEIEAVKLILKLATESGCPLEIVHISLAKSVGLLAQARAAHPQLKLIGEVCLQHLLADASLYESGHEPALAAICSPPLRGQENCDLLRDALSRGQLELLSTDHCEFALKTKAAAASGGFHKIPNGCGGVGERVVFSHTHLVAKGNLDPAQWIHCLAENPARLMGLAGRKGSLQPGYDADIVLFDPRPKYTWQPLGPSDQAGNLYAGQPVQGVVRDVWLRGRQVVESGRLMGGQPAGQFLPRQLTQ